jgi:myosin heavy subunit
MFLWWKKSMPDNPIIDELPEGDVFDKFSPDPKVIENPAPADQAIELDPIPNGSPIFSFDKIAYQLELCLEETSDLDTKLKASDAKIKQIEIENGKLIKLNHELRARVGILEASAQNQRKHASALEGTVQRQRAEINNLHQATKSKKTQKNQVDQINGLQSLVHRQQQEHTATIIRYETLQGYAHKISEKAENLQLDLELLRCTTGGPQKAISTEASVGMMHLTPQPFVAVLIDGDAYAVSLEN